MGKFVAFFAKPDNKKLFITMVLDLMQDRWSKVRNSDYIDMNILLNDISYHFF